MAILERTVFEINGSRSVRGLIAQKVSADEKNVQRMGKAQAVKVKGASRKCRQNMCPGADVNARYVYIKHLLVYTFPALFASLTDDEWKKLGRSSVHLENA